MVELTRAQKLKLFTYLCKVYVMRNGKKVEIKKVNKPKKKKGCGCGR